MIIASIDPLIHWWIEESIPWLVIHSNQEKGAEGPVDLTLQAYDLQLSEGDYIGKISAIVDGADTTPLQVPVCFSIRRVNSGQGPFR